jgi:hypothetical protein
MRIFSPAMALAAAATLTGCASNSPDQNGAIGGIGAAIITEAAGGNDLQVAGAFILGSIAASQYGDPCVTRQSGRVTETSINGRRGRSQSQTTAYNCTSRGAPSGAKPPVFMAFDGQEPIAVLTSVEFTQMFNSNLDMITELAERYNITEEQLIKDTYNSPLLVIYTENMGLKSRLPEIPALK